jgi:regulator of replication initiation timing
MPKSQKNDNLAKYRERQQEQNQALVQRAIEYIQQLNGEVNFSLVSKVTYDIADATKGEKGISLAGLSKNKIYRSMIEKAKLSNGVNADNLKKSIRSSVSIGDMQMSFHTIRVENAKLKMENKVLSERLKEINAPVQELGNIDMNIMKQYDEMKQVCSSLVSRLLELELAYIDNEAKTLNIVIYDEVILQKQSLELFYKKELYAIEN